MATQKQTIVTGAEECEGTYVKKTKRFLIFFNTHWWEQVSSTHIGNDIYIETNRPIRKVFINGEQIFEEIKK